MMKNVMIFVGLIVLMGCATQRSKEGAVEPAVKRAGPSSTTTKTSSTATNTTVKSSIVVDQKALQKLEDMNRALEAFVLKNESKKFTSLCKEKRFDCFVDDVLYPKNKKRAYRKVPPYASGSKMGLQGEQRVQARYDFYP